jgi:aminopeptidase
MRERISAYAKLLVETGVNVQKGQSLLIAASVDHAKFVRMCAEAAYDAGCREVNIMWRDDKLSRMKYLRADDEVFDEYPTWLAAMYNDTSARGDAFLSISSSDPEAMKGVDPSRIRRSSIAAGKAIQPFRLLQMADGIQWSIGAVPSPEWARKVFPDVSESDAVADLWNAILESVRVYEGGDPAAEWANH